jgi:hypothetical protein
MTQATARPNPVIETLRVRGAEADQLAREVGCQVIQIGPTRGPGVWVEEAKADQLAASLVKDHPDRMYAVMAPSRIYHGANYTAPAPESEAGK